jgi:hypothetical protein
MPKKPELNLPIAQRELPPEVIEARAEFAAECERVEPVARPRIEANLMACQLVLDRLENLHGGIADKTDLELTGYGRGAAIWMLAGRCLGLARALLVQARAGIDNECLVTGRAIHEATRVLLVFGDPDEEELLRLWLDDEGKHDYVKAAAARAAQERFEAKLDEAMTRIGLPAIGRTGDLSAEVYDQMSRTAHSRRSSCANSVSEELRTATYGHHPSPYRRASCAEWTAAMTVEVTNVVGDALRAFYGQGFFVDEMVPLIQSIEAVRRTAPLSEEALSSAADWTRFVSADSLSSGPSFRGLMKPTIEPSSSAFVASIHPSNSGSKASRARSA